MIVAVGISNLQYVDLNSTRNLLVIGLSLLFGLSLPWWLKANPEAIKTGKILFTLQTDDQFQKLINLEIVQVYKC